MYEKELSASEEAQLSLTISKAIESAVGAQTPFILLIPGPKDKGTIIFTDLPDLMVKHNLLTAALRYTTGEHTTLAVIDRASGKVLETKEIKRNETDKNLN